MGAASVTPIAASASVITSPLVQVQGNAQVSGTFIYNDLEFVEQILQTYTGSHTFGGPSGSEVQTFSGSIYVTGGVTSSNGFSGSGAGLTNITATNVGYETLTIGDGLSGSNFNFTGDSTMSVQLSGSDSGLALGAVGVYIPNDAATTRMFATASVLSSKIGNTHIHKGNLTSSIITDHSSAAVHATNEYLAYPLPVTPTFNRKVTQAQLTSYIGDQITAASGNATGSVTEISVLPLTGSTDINHLFLSIENPTTTPAISMGGTVQVGNAQWTASSPGAVDGYLSIANGGTGFGTQAEAATHILATSQEGALTIGAIENNIKISGSLLLNESVDEASDIFTDNLHIKDKFLLLGQGETDGVVDIGIQFGADATSSNAIIWNENSGFTGRLSFGNSLDPSTTINTTPKYHLLGVHSGSISTADQVAANQTGNMLVDSDAEIYLWI
jgi:hypothetical protein